MLFVLYFLLNYSLLYIYSFKKKIPLGYFVFFLLGKISITKRIHFLISCFSNRMFTEGICKLLDLIITDLIDEDQFIHQRIFSLPTLIFGIMAFLSKPGQTFASLISSRLFYSLNNQRKTVFNHLIIIPILCSLCQIILWSKFTLHSHRLKSIRSILKYSSHHFII
jgi:hypothetical protein